MDNAKAVIGSLLHDVEMQLYAEYDSKERVEHELETMTVKRLLEILSYLY